MPGAFSMNEIQTHPDDAEQVLASTLDDPVPSRGYQLLPLVGIGGSAGSIPALEHLLAAIPPVSGLAFVVVLHLSRDHDSILAEMLQRFTAIPVRKVVETCKVEADTIYVIPSGKALKTYDGYLHLAELPLRRHRHVAVDLFFRTLADTHGPHATAVILSGMDGDGAVGIKRIKERGGLTIAQEPSEAEFPGMPQSAISTGMVDWVLPVADIAPRVLEYYEIGRRMQLPSEQLPVLPDATGELKGDDETAFRDILSFLHSRSGRDLSCYKRATIIRRLGRRMQANGIDNLQMYLNCLRTRPGEAGALLKDLLISVTNFFRDPDCFTALEKMLPEVFKDKGPGDTVRVWAAACATGEEAFSLAMLLSDHARKLDAPPLIQIFASDLDDEAIATARNGFYPHAIQADISEERLLRYFLKEADGYRVRREIREMILFAVHDVLSDSPFSHLDLVTCRNLLIYLSREAQVKVLDTFHFALRSRGLMMLGTSESVDESNPAFTLLDKPNRIFASLPLERISVPIPRPGSRNALILALEARTQARAWPVVPSSAFAGKPPFMPTPVVISGRPAGWGTVHREVLEQVAPPSILLDGNLEMLHLSSTAGQYLQYNGGDLTRNVLRCIHPGLRMELRTALHKAATSRMAAQTAPVSFLLGELQVVVARVVPIHREEARFVVMILALEAMQGTDISAEPDIQISEIDAATSDLHEQLDHIQLHLRDTVEQYEASNEELKANNEELHAMNEELRSASEELETSREELQSINEELTTVNLELKIKVEELGSSNSDMLNLMDATDIATVFLDRRLCVTRFTPKAVELFHLIKSDLGRPLADLASQLDYPDLFDDSRRVLKSLATVEREVSRNDEQWFMVRALPYRTLDDRIAGVVLTFVDITERKRSQEALRHSQERITAIVSEATTGVVQASLEGNIDFSNRSYQSMMGYEEGELFGMSLLELVHPDDREESAHLFDRLVQQGLSFQVEKRCLRKDGSIIWTSNSVSRLSSSEGKPGAALIMSTDITERKNAEHALSRSEEQLRLIMENAVEYAIFSTDATLNITRWNPGAERLLGYTEIEVLGQAADMIFTEEDRSAGEPAREMQRAMSHGKAADDRMHVRKDGSRFWASGAIMPMMSDGSLVGFVKVLRDQSHVRLAQDALERSRADIQYALELKEKAHTALEVADVAKDRFLAVLSHELRNPLASVRSTALALRSGKLNLAEQEQALNILWRQSGSMKNLLDDLLDISRLRHGRLVLHCKPVLLATVVQSAVEAVQPVMDAASHQLIVDAQSNDLVIHADQGRFTQVITNLLANAAKYTPDGGRIELKTRQEGRDVVVTVADNGAGIDPEKIERMFEMFVQESVDQPGSAGLGIGLALVRNIVQLHGGSVVGHSAGLGLGSTFIIRLPLSAAELSMSTVSSSPTIELIEPPAKLKVLLADDNPDILWSVGKIVEFCGCKVQGVGGGLAALEAIRMAMPDVVILDIGMPDMNGHEVARHIRTMPGGHDVLLVAATGWGQEADRLEARDAGFDVHLVKPIEQHDVRILLDDFRSKRFPR